ncbi:hypothetical protein N9463_02160 [Planktomarina sp.]|nr:hypothetical protein [Planktomarina sp.]
MSKADNDEPPIIAKFGSVIVDYDGAQLIKETCIYIIFNCLICLFGVVVLVVNGAIANVIIPVIFVYFGIKKADELIKGQMKDITRIRQIIWSIVLISGSIFGIFLIIHVSSIISDMNDGPVLPFWVLITFQLLPMLLIYNGAVLLIRTKRSAGFRVELTARQKLYADYQRWLEA